MIEIPALMGLRMINDGSVSLLSTRFEEKTNVCTLSWQTPLSQDPPMVGFSLAPSSRSHDFLRQTGEFVLSIPDASLIAETHFCGTHTGKIVDKIRLMELRTMRARRVSPLLITNCIGHLEGVVRSWQPIGDRVFYTGEVLTALVEPDCFNAGWKDQAQTLHHLGGDLYRTAGGTLHAGKFPLPMSRTPQAGLFDNPREERFL